MDAKEYLKERGRMTNECNAYSCRDCKLGLRHNGSDLTCQGFEYKCPEKAVAIVEQWAKEHPVKTYKSVFLEKFPDTVTDFMGDPHLCLKYVFGRGSEIKGCEQSALCHECWNREVEE